MPGLDQRPSRTGAGACRTHRNLSRRPGASGQAGRAAGRKDGPPLRRARRSRGPAAARDLPAAIPQGLHLRRRAAIVPYLAKLGISHVYASPIQRPGPARPTATTSSTTRRSTRNWAAALDLLDRARRPTHAADRIAPPRDEAALQRDRRRRRRRDAGRRPSRSRSTIAATDRLVFRVAAGPEGGGVVGLEIAAHEGIAGYVFSTGQPLAVADVVADPRFERTTAERTGYVPRSLLAVPLADEEGTLGVMEFLDRRDGVPFDLVDLERAGVSRPRRPPRSGRPRLDHDARRPVRAATLAAIARGSRDGHAGLDARSRRALLAAVADRLDDDDPLWRLADRIGRLRQGDPRRRRPRDRLARRPPRPPGVAANPPAADVARTGGGDERPDPAGLERRVLPATPSGLERVTAARDHGPGCRVRGDPTVPGVTVAIIDSGVEADHPAVGGRLVRSLRVEVGRTDSGSSTTPTRSTWSATARRVPGSSTRSPRPRSWSRSASWAPTTAAVARPSRRRSSGPSAERFGVVNLSLSSRSESMAGRFHELADAAYFANTLLVCAANNVTGPSYPSLFAAVVSVAAHDVARSRRLVLQPVATGRVRRPRPRRGRRVASRRADPGDRQLVRGAAPGRPGGADPRPPPRSEPVRGQDHARGDGHRPADMKTPPGRWAVSGRRWRSAGPLLLECSGPAPSSSVGMASPPWLGERWVRPAGRCRVRDRSRGPRRRR